MKKGQHVVGVVFKSKLSAARIYVLTFLFVVCTPTPKYAALFFLWGDAKRTKKH